MRVPAVVPMRPSAPGIGGGWGSPWSKAEGLYTSSTRVTAGGREAEGDASRPGVLPAVGGVVVLLVSQRLQLRLSSMAACAAAVEVCWPAAAGVAGGCLSGPQAVRGPPPPLCTRRLSLLQHHVWQAPPNHSMVCTIVTIGMCAHVAFEPHANLWKRQTRLAFG